MNNILIVDDDARIRDVVRFALEDSGFQTTEAGTGQEALDLFCKSPADLIVLDIGMPGMGGHQCLKALIEMDPAVNILIATGYALEGQVKKTLERGASGFIGKPYQISDLIRTVRAVLDKDIDDA